MDDPLYRDLLVRWCAPIVKDPSAPRTLCLGLQNPSTAGEERNDPTVLRSIGFATRLRFERLVIVNTYLRRFTQPRDLYAWLGGLTPEQRHGEREGALAIMRAQALAADLFIAGWGNGHPDHDWPNQLADELAAAGVAIYCLGVNKNGTPKHPLARGKNRIPDDQRPVLWRAAERSPNLHG